MDQFDDHRFIYLSIYLEIENAHEWRGAGEERES